MYRGNKMISEINSFTAYLQEVKHTAKIQKYPTTGICSRWQDLWKNGDHTGGEGDEDQFEFLYPVSGKEGKAAATISRELASIKAFSAILLRKER